VTTNYILSELVALLTVRSRFTRPELLAIINGIRRITHLNLVHIDPEMDAAAWALLEQYNDKAWSVVDAASFVVMRRMSLTEAFTSDHHVTQADLSASPPSSAAAAAPLSPTGSSCKPHVTRM
jgi:uncharacterized protein